MTMADVNSADECHVSYILDQTRDYVTLINRDYRYELANRPYCDAVGKSRNEVIGAAVSDLWGEEIFREKIRPSLDKCFAGETVEYIEQFAFGDFLRHVHVVILPYRGDGDAITHVLVLSHDITHLTEIESKLTRYEYFDPLTGLFNRRSLGVVLDKEIFKTQRANSSNCHGVLFLQLRDFGRINETYGTEVADLLIENTAVRVKQQVRDSDYVFRFEGSSLTVLLTNIVRDTDVAIVAEKIHDAVTMPYHYRDIVLSLDAVVGIAVYPKNGTTSAELIRNATSAVAESKRSHAPYAIYDKGLHDAAMKRLRRKTELQYAFEARQFELHYQPLVTADGTVKGAEALIRWNHPEEGLLSPAAFIGLAEETGLIGVIDKWALFAVSRFLTRIADHFDCFVSINLSAEDLLDRDLTPVVEQALSQQQKIPADRLKLELTERITMHEPDRAVEAITYLEGIGVEVWIDDFGSGISSLNFLRRLPATRLKIDKSFVDDIHVSEQERAYLIDILSLVRTRGKGHVIEGVANAEQFAVLRELDVELLQGYYFSRPIPEDDFVALLQSGRTLP